MSAPSLPQPDPLPLREALRVLRHGFRRGRRVLRDTVPVDILPRPAARLAGGLFHRLDSLAQGFDEATTGLARRLLVEDAPVPSLADLASGPESQAAFASALYAGLRTVLRRLGDEEAFVSEALARKAYVGVAGASGDPASVAAELALSLLAEQVVRDISVPRDLPGDAVAPVAVVGVLLWMMSDRQEGEAEESLAAATDLALALSAEISAAARARDLKRLASIFREFASHV